MPPAHKDSGELLAAISRVQSDLTEVREAVARMEGADMPTRIRKVEEHVSDIAVLATEQKATNTRLDGLTKAVNHDQGDFGKRLGTLEKAWWKAAGGLTVLAGLAGFLGEWLHDAIVRGLHP